MNPRRKVLEWAGAHYEEFLVVCGLRNTGTNRTTEIWRMLEQDGLEELSEMLALRMFQFYFEDDPESVQADKQSREDRKRKANQDTKEPDSL